MSLHKENYINIKEGEGVVCPSAINGNGVKVDSNLIGRRHRHQDSEDGDEEASSELEEDEEPERAALVSPCPSKANKQNEALDEPTQRHENGVTLGSAWSAGLSPIPKIISPLNLDGPQDNLLRATKIRPYNFYQQRPTSANPTNDNSKSVFFRRQEVAESPDHGSHRSVAHSNADSNQKVNRNFSVESSGSHASGKGHSHKVRKSRSRSSMKPPDGGWGWVVVFSSFMISMIADGISFSFGIFFVDLSNYFGASKSKTAFVGSLFLSMPLLIGPVASAMTDRYGCRNVTIVSGFLSAFGFILGYFAYSLEHLFIAFSISGAGLALSYVTSIVIVAYYFEKRRSLATGLAVCGTGFGTFIFAPLTIYLMEKFSWRGTLLIFAGFFLNIIVFGMLMRDLPEAPSDDEDCISDRSCDFESDNLANEALENNMHYHLNNKPLDTTSNNGNLSNPKPRLFSSLVNIPTYITHRGSTSDPQDVTNILNEMTQRKGGYLSQLLQRYPNVLSSFVFGQRDLPRGFLGSSGNSNNATSTNCISGVGARRAESKLQLNTITEKKPLAQQTPNGSATFNAVNPKSPDNSSSVRSPRLRPSTNTVNQNRLNSLTPEGTGAHHLRNLKLQRGSISYRSAMLNIKRYRLRASSCPDIYRNSMLTISGDDSPSRNCFEDVKETFTDLIDFSIFKSVKYTLFCFSNLLLYMCIDVPYVYMPDHAIHTGTSEREASSFLISVIGIVNTLGIVLVGYIGDKPWIEPATLYSCFIALSGVSIGLIPWIHDYAGLATLAALYGFTISANYALVSVILVDLISLDKFTNGYGLLLLVQGIASLIGPPFAGWLYDMTGSYDVTFYVTGLCIFISGAIVIPVAGGTDHCAAILLARAQAKAELCSGAKNASGMSGSGSPSRVRSELSDSDALGPLLDCNKAALHRSSSQRAKDDPGPC